MVKRIVSGVLIFLALIFLVSGCKPGGEVTFKNGAEAPLTWYMPGDKQTDMQAVLDEVNKIITPQLGSGIDIQFIDSGSFQDKMTMMLASGKGFDLCFTSDWNNKFLPNVNKGAYMPLDELMEKHTPEFKGRFPSYLWNASTVKGKIYAVPNLQVLFYQTSLVVQKKYAEKYNLDVSKIRKTEDIEGFLEKIKENEKGVYPYRAAYGVGMFITPKYEEIEPATGVLVEKNSSDIKLVSSFKTDEFKHGIRVIRDWFEKGYIRPDVASVMNDDQDLAAGKYAIYPASYKPGVEAEVLVRTKQDWVFIPIEEPYLKANAGMATMTAVSRTSKNPDKAIKFLELVNTNKALYNLLSFGIEEKHYKKVNSEQIELIPESGYSPNASWKFGNQFNAFYLSNQKPGIWQETEKINNSATRSPISGFVFDTEPIKNELSQCSTVLKEYKLINYGSEDPDLIYDKLIEKLESAGHQRIVEEAQRQIDEWLKLKK